MINSWLFLLNIFKNWTNFFFLKNFIFKFFIYQIWFLVHWSFNLRHLKRYFYQWMCNVVNMTNLLFLFFFRNIVKISLNYRLRFCIQISTFWSQRKSSSQIKPISNWNIFTKIKESFRFNFKLSLFFNLFFRNNTQISTQIQNWRTNIIPWNSIHNTLTIDSILTYFLNHTHIQFDSFSTNSCLSSFNITFKLHFFNIIGLNVTTFWILNLFSLTKNTTFLAQIFRCILLILTLK